MDSVNALTALRLLRTMRKAALEMLFEWDNGQPAPLTKDVVKAGLKANLDLVAGLLPADFPTSRLGDLKRHLHFAERHDFVDISLHDIVDVEEKIIGYISSNELSPAKIGFEDLVHPLISKAALPHYRQGHYRVAVLEGVGAVLHLLQHACLLNEDGDALIGRTLNPEKPLLAIADVGTPAGKSKQRGLMLLCQGAYARFRNPRAHTGALEVDEREAAAELITLSRLMGELVEAAKLAGKNLPV